MAYYKSYAKTTSWTPKGELAERIKTHCTKTIVQNGREFHFRNGLNPQDLVRMALLDSGVIHKDQSGGGDTSCWEPGEAIKTFLWIENHNDLVQFAKEQGQNKQQIINGCVEDYLNSLPVDTDADKDA